MRRQSRNDSEHLWKKPCHSCRVMKRKTKLKGYVESTFLVFSSFFFSLDLLQPPCRIGDRGSAKDPKISFSNFRPVGDFVSCYSRNCPFNAFHILTPQLTILFNMFKYPSFQEIVDETTLRLDRFATHAPLCPHLSYRRMDKER